MKLQMSPAAGQGARPNNAGWNTRAQRGRAALTAVLFLLIAGMLFIARRALMPLAIGTVFAYIMLPVINWLDAHTRLTFRRRHVLRSLLVLIVYLLTVTVLVASLAAILPPLGAQVQVLTRRLPVIAANIYRAAPTVVQSWLETYNEIVPETIRLAIQRSFENTVQSLANTLQTGVLKSVNLLFTTVSFVIGLLVVPLWMFYVLRDQPEMSAAFYRIIPPAYREDARHMIIVLDSLLGSYLRGQLILCLSVGIMTTVGLTLLGVDLALLLGTLAGIFEVVPVLGPILGAIPAIIVTLAASPANLPWVIALAFTVQQVENYVLVPQVARGSVHIPPALAILVLIVGSEVGGVLGAILSLPLTATVRDLAHYLYLRLADEPLSPQEAVLNIRGRSLSPSSARQPIRRETEESAAQTESLPEKRS
jgi:predicted PurR-regulated permease PerM